MYKKQRLNIALIKPPLVGHKHRGTGVYARNLYSALEKSEEVNVSLTDYKDKLESFDIVHYPYFDPFFLTLPFFRRKPAVVTVHDLIPLKFPQHFPPGARGFIKWQIQRLSLSRSNAVITDSFSSKEDIIKYAGVSEDKINVIYLGTEEEFKIIHTEKRLEEVKNKLKLPDKFILHVGDVNYNKNIKGLVKAFSTVGKFYPLLNLVLVGNGFINPSPQLLKIKKLIESLNIQDKIHFIGHVTIDELVGLYNLAKVYLQPSFAEGFGLPVLEAIACGTPAIVGNLSSLPEIVGKAAILVDPYNVDDIAKEISKILHFDTATYRSIVEKGLRQAKKFSWNKCAGKTLEVYKKVVSNK